MRLPTETEWLYACRGSSVAVEAPTWAASAKSLDRCCWHDGNSEGLVQPPERRDANGFGLHGMLGSVWEWVASAPDGDEPHRTLCGGSFRTEACELHYGLIKREAADFRADDTGFRVARSFRVSG